MKLLTIAVLIATSAHAQYSVYDFNNPAAAMQRESQRAELQNQQLYNMQQQQLMMQQQMAIPRVTNCTTDSFGNTRCVTQ